MTYHAVEEMAEDGLNIFDIENAILTGKILKTDKNDPRGVKYLIKGLGNDKTTPIDVVGRFKETEVFFRFS